MTLVSDLINFSTIRWPLDSAAHWDNPGLAAGSPNAEIKKVLLSVDFTEGVLEEAAVGGYDLIFTHHPFFFRAVTSLAEDSAKGSLASKLIRAKIALFSAHTNADFVSGGVSEVLAKWLGLENLRPLTSLGEGILGDVAEVTLLDYSRAVAKLLPSCAQGILVQGIPEKRIKSVGLVAGAGDSYIGAALEGGVDLFITSDLRHHPASDFRDAAAVAQGPALMSIPHFAAEWPWLAIAAKELKQAFPSVEFEVSEINTDPWTFAVMQ